MELLPENLPFQGIVLFDGSEHLPGDLVIALSELRRWATNVGLIWDAGAQFLSDERVDEIVKVIEPGDELSVAVAVESENGELTYAEYPYLSTRSLIRRGASLPLVYWRLRPVQWDSNGAAAKFDEVRFGFWLPGCSDEFCSMSTAHRVVPKFVDQMNQLGQTHPIKEKAQGAREIIVEGAVSARFLKQGRAFDVELSEAPSA